MFPKLITLDTVYQLIISLVIIIIIIIIIIVSPSTRILYTSSAAHTYMYTIMLTNRRLSEAVPMRPFFRAKKGGRCRMHLTRGRNLQGKYIFCLFDSTD